MPSGITGEVTLTGRVLPIGGLKEKTLAARRSSVKTLVFPAGNRKDWDELSGALSLAARCRRLFSDWRRYRHWTPCPTP